MCPGIGVAMSVSRASIVLVREYFYAHQFLVREVASDVLLVTNPLPAQAGGRCPFVVDDADVGTLPGAVVRPVPWHTVRFSPAVLKRSPEIFLPFVSRQHGDIERLCGGEAFERVLVIPALPASERLRQESIEFLQGQGVTHVLSFGTVISGVIDRINPRQVYTSDVAEILRILKWYRFVRERQATLPFDES